MKVRLKIKVKMKSKERSSDNVCVFVCHLSPANQETT